MTSLDLAFGATGLLALVGGLLAVTTRHVVHAALWLVVALLGVAGSLLVLGSELVSLVLVLVYVGAIVVLVLFALMVTRAPIGPDTAVAVAASSLAIRKSATSNICAYPPADWVVMRYLPAITSSGCGIESASPRSGEGTTPAARSP